MYTFFIHFPFYGIEQEKRITIKSKDSFLETNKSKQTIFRLYLMVTNQRKILVDLIHIKKSSDM